MNIERYDYPLTKEHIAQYPVDRGKERLLTLDMQSGDTQHRRFEDLERYLKEGDLLVLNDTRVIRARLLGKKDSGGKVEMLLIKRLDAARWKCFLKASKQPKLGSVINFSNALNARIEDREENIFEVTFSDPERIFHTGQIPLPPYIERFPDEADETMYQTVYARHEGSVAAPTAGLHFTPEYLEKLVSKGVEMAFLTLHVGPGTFVPVRTSRVEDHKMHSEDFFISEEAAETIQRARDKGKRIVAVGTTTTRVLEHLMSQHGRIVPGQGSTDIFIYEGFRFKIVDALLTNFHLPCSTLLMLVTAFGGYDRVMKSYRAALEEGYRFFSYGDAMFIF